MNMKSTRRALLTSILSLVLCCTMLIGTTFAWFTDTVTSGGNRIQAGTLDIDLLMDKQLNGSYASIAEGSGDIFTLGNATKVAQNSNDTLWEPGKTQVVYLAIENKGSLHAKYSVDILAKMPAGTTADMTQAMEYAITPDAKAASTTPAWVSGDKLALGTTRVTEDIAIDAGATHYFALSVHMDEDAGNEYQGQAIEFDLAVTATQNAVEEDSFDEKYDKDATYEATLATGTATADVNASNETTAETTVEAKNATGTTVATLTVPAGTKLEDENSNISITVTPKDEVEESVPVAVTQGAKTYDVEVTGIEDNQEVEVEMYVGTGLTGVKLYHNNVEVTPITYNATTGIVSFTTNSFSPYTVVYNGNNDLPFAIVKNLDNKDIRSTVGFGGEASEMTLDVAYQFEPANTLEEAQNSPYRYWHADFVVSANKDVPAEAVTLAGYYSAWCNELNEGNWVAISSAEAIPADTEIRLVEGLGNGGITVNYEELCKYGNDGVGFRCGAAGTEEVKGTTLTVELRLYETEEPSTENGNSHNVETEKYVVIGTYSYTF